MFKLIEKRRSVRKMFDVISVITLCCACILVVSATKEPGKIGTMYPFTKFCRIFVFILSAIFIIIPYMVSLSCSLYAKYLCYWFIALNIAPLIYSLKPSDSDYKIYSYQRALLNMITNVATVIILLVWLAIR